LNGESEFLMADRTDIKYFSQQKLWSAPVHEQVMVARDVIKLIPDDVVTILDAGCGNGAVTNDMVKNWDVVGCDLSEHALQSVLAPKLVADLRALPFRDQSFDLVIATDVIEHLPNDMYSKALQELARVSKKYVLIAVPHNEIMEAAFVTCPKCTHRYHAHLHQRTYQLTDLPNLFSAALKPKKVIFSGERWKFSSPSLVDAEFSITERDYPFENAVCPCCGTRRGKKEIGDSSLSVSRRIEAYQAMLSGYGYLPLPDKSEIVALYQRTGAPQQDVVEEVADFEAIRTEANVDLSLSTLSTKEDPVNYSESEYLLDNSGKEKIIFLKKSPELVRVKNGSVDSIDFFDYVQNQYLPTEIISEGVFGFPEFAFGARGALIRLKCADADAEVHIEYRKYESREQIISVCFDNENIANQHLQRIASLNLLAESLEKKRNELEILIKQRDHHYSELNEKFRALEESLPRRRPAESYFSFFKRCIIFHNKKR